MGNVDYVSSLEQFVVNSLSERLDSQWNVELVINGYSITFKIDTGASCNLFSRSWFDKMNHSKSQLKPSPQVKTYSGQS